MDGIKINKVRAGLVLICGLFTSTLFSQELKRVEPPSWWVGMNNTELQLMLYGEDIAKYTVDLSYPGVAVKRVTKLENPNYLMLDLDISTSTKAGKFDIHLLKRKRKVASYKYELQERESNSADRMGFDASDALYLITPDRFANGNEINDSSEGMREIANRKAIGGRHGGDIKGMADGLDYIHDLGFTAIWINPLLENDMKRHSYHGYSTTDFYKVDPRFGTNSEYRDFVSSAHEKGLKIIMDMIVNHCGSLHWWMDDLPSSDWLNYQDLHEIGAYQETTHRKTVVQDPYASEIDKKEMIDGWFVPTMPDLNHDNPFMANYIIQNAIWWIEYLDLDGIRMDTYPYSGPGFMADWTCAVQNEYPYFNTVGEEWYEDPAILSYWQQGKENRDGYTSCLPSLMDFPLQESVCKALKNPQDAWSGWLSIYTTLALDFLYASPEDMVIFPDNHDMSRFYTQVDESLELFKLGLAFYATTRGVPQIYYGTEVLMTNPGTTDHGVIRSDFPGGWTGDVVNAFLGKGLNVDQEDAQKYVTKLFNWRKGNEIIHYGKLKHYNPKNGLYVYFRHTEKGKVMVILSKNTDDVQLDVSRFSELLQVDNTGTEIISDTQIDFAENVIVPAMTPMIIEID